MVDAVSETYRCSWDRVFEMTVFHWVNLYIYGIEKSKEEKRKIDNWKRKN